NRRKKLRNNMTKAEIKLWCVLKGNKFTNYKFRRQRGIGFYIVDFYCPKIKLVIELDGGQHLKLNNMMYDKKRTEYLNSLGVVVVRFFNNEILENIEEVWIKINEIINKLA
ncbi:endonuclease domain-containing protein, partial [bacterium]|nr:endonuclease domain-containing protein [bacterium]